MCSATHTVYSRVLSISSGATDIRTLTQAHNLPPFKASLYIFRSRDVRMNANTLEQREATHLWVWVSRKSGKRPEQSDGSCCKSTVLRYVWLRCGLLERHEGTNVAHWFCLCDTQTRAWTTHGGSCILIKAIYWHRCLLHPSGLFVPSSQNSF